MLKSRPLTAFDRLTPRARAFAYPQFSPAAREIIAARAAEASAARLDPEHLMALARRDTGLEDFCDGPLAEPLTALKLEIKNR